MEKRKQKPTLIMCRIIHIAHTHTHTDDMCELNKMIAYAFYFMRNTGKINAA